MAERTFGHQNEDQETAFHKYFSKATSEKLWEELGLLEVCPNIGISAFTQKIA